MLASGGVVPPIQPSTTFARDRNYALHASGNIYSRDDNDVGRVAEGLLAQPGQCAGGAVVSKRDGGDCCGVSSVANRSLRACAIANLLGYNQMAPRILYAPGFGLGGGSVE